MNNQKGFTFVDFLIQLIFVVLFVIVLVWLFPTKDYLKNNLNNETIFYEKDTDVSDSTFVNNINNMMEASKSYFGYNVALPEKIGEEVTVTLGELADEHVIIMPKDKNGNKCSKDSFATITKTSFGYSIKVSLTCGNQTDYIIRSVGCDPFCQNDCNTKCKLEYQYVKTTKGYWTDWSKFSEWSTKKVIESDTMKVETKVVDTKTCPSGYKLNSSKTACVKNVTSQVVSTPNQILSCPSGYTLKGNKCYKTVTTTINQNAEVVLSCPSGYTLNEQKTSCIKTTNVTNTVDAQEVKTCPSGYTLNGTKCTKIEQASVINNTTYTCPSGYTLNGTKCTRTSATNLISNTSYTCPSGYNLSNNICTKTISIDSTERIYHGCNSGYTYISSNKTCRRVRFVTLGESTNAKCSITYETDCTNGCKVVQKETCIVEANSWSSYSCPDGYTLSSNKLKCNRTESVSPTQTTTQTCPSGYTQNGNKCTRTEIISATANITKTCPSGYTLNGSKCTKTVTTSATTTYTCNAGTLNGDKCLITSSSTDVKDVIKNYKCTSGKLVGTTCVIDTTTEDVVNATTTNTCTVGTLTNNSCVVSNTNVQTTSYNIVKVTYYRYSTKKYVEGSTTYKWSTSREDKSLLNSGYSLTGKTRENCS